jgi:hypothetical protein
VAVDQRLKLLSVEEMDLGFNLKVLAGRKSVVMMIFMWRKKICVSLGREIE